VLGVGPTNPKRHRELGSDALRGFSEFLSPTARRGGELWSMVQPITTAHPAAKAVREAGHRPCRTGVRKDRGAA